MILFEEDWARYPTAIPDYNTNNKSFLRLVSLYHSMGVKNCLFPLALYDPDLSGVDPHDPTLTLDQKAKVVLETRYNPWYFWREVVRIPPSSSTEGIPFIANRGNIAVFWTYFNNIDCCLIQPRQTGKSCSTDTMMIWLVYMGADNCRIVLITKDDKLRKENIDRLKRIRDRLPKYLLQLSREDADNKYELSCEARGNRYITLVGQNSEAAANNMGRGFTAPTMQFDEAPFTPFIGDTVPAALAAGTRARADAERNGQPYGNIFTTTAGKKDDRDGKFIYKMISRGAPWDETFLDTKNKADLKDMVTKNGSGKKLFINITMSHRQLGYTDEWLRDVIIQTESEGEKADRDFFNRWTSGSQSSPLTPRLNEIIRDSQTEPTWTQRSKDNYLLRWYVGNNQEDISAYMREHYIVAGLDTSGGGGRDNITLVLRDAKDLSVVAVGTYNETNLIRLAGHLADLMYQYPTLTLVPERNYCQAIIDALMILLPKYGIDPFTRIFNMIIEERHDRTEDYQMIQRGVHYRSDTFYDRYKTIFGFQTTAKSRGELYGTILQNAAKKSGHLTRDKYVIDEILGLVEKNGRVDHEVGGHDDHVIAWLLSMWFLTKARHLNEYGIPDGYALQDVAEEGHKITPEQIQERQEQEQLMAQIDAVTDQLDSTRDEFITMKLQHRLKSLIARLKYEERDVHSMDELIRTSSEERKKRNFDQLQPYRPLERGISGIFGGSGSHHQTMDRYSSHMLH